MFGHFDGGFATGSSTPALSTSASLHSLKSDEINAAFMTGVQTAAKAVTLFHLSRARLHCSTSTADASSIATTPLAAMSSSATTPASPAGDAARSAVFVGNLAGDVDERQLIEKFCCYGPIQSVWVCRESQTRSSLGYAYVVYDQLGGPMAALKAQKELNNAVLLGKPVVVKMSSRNFDKRCPELSCN